MKQTNKRSFITVVVEWKSCHLVADIKQMITVLAYV